MTQGGRTPAEERPSPPSNPKTGDRQATSRRTTNILYLVGDPRETKFVSGSFDKAYPHLNLDFSVPLGEARQRIAEAGRFDVLLVGWSVPEAEALALIGHVREQSYPLAIVAACEAGADRFRQAGADECVVKGGSFLARLPTAIDEALQKRGAPAAAAAPAAQSLRIAYSGDVEFVRTALKGEPSTPQFMALNEALEGTACDIVLLDHTPAANTATTLADIRGRNLDVAIVLLFNQQDEVPVLRTFASDIHDFIVKTPGWATRLPLRMELAHTRYQQVRELAALKIKEARLRSMVDTLPACIVRLSPEGTVLAVNAVALSLLGATEARQLLRKQFYSLVNPSDRDAYNDFVVRVCSGETRSTEVSVTTLTGEGRTLQVSAVPTATESGGPASALTVLRDVTDRKRLEAAVEKAANQAPVSEVPVVHEVERFGEVPTIERFGEAPTIERFGEPTTVERFEPTTIVQLPPPPVESQFALESELGLTPQVPMELPPAIAPPPATIERASALPSDPKALRELEADLQRLSGRARAAFEELEASLREAEARHEATTTRQLEERTRLEALQQERWRSYDEFVQNAVQGIFHATLAADLLDVNPSFAAALGYGSSDDLIAEGTAIARFTSDDEWQRAVEAWRKGSNDAVESRWKRKDGGILAFRLHGRLMSSQQGDADRLEVIVENLTSQRALEGQLRRARKWEDVARVTTGIAADLKHTVASLNESADRFIAGLSPDDADREHAAAIRQGASKAFSLSSQLIAFGRKASRDPEQLDINAVVRTLEPTVRRVIDEHIELTLDLAPGLNAVEADRPTVEEAVVNLGVAASEALPAGGRLDITTFNVEVERFSAEHPPGIQAGSYVLLMLTASGWGVEQSSDDRLTRKPLEPMTRAVGRLGGYLKVEGVAGESLTFRVYLPQAQTAEAVER